MESNHCYFSLCSKAFSKHRVFYHEPRSHTHKKNTHETFSKLMKLVVGTYDNQCASSRSSPYTIPCVLLKNHQLKPPLIHLQPIDHQHHHVVHHFKHRFEHYLDYYPF